MPTYDYVCDACKHEMELFQSISEDPIKKCPNCKKNKLRRLIGAGAGILFKGSGFYQTDYRSDSYKKKAEAESKSQNTSASGESKSTGTESKSASDKSSGGGSESKATKPTE